MINAKYSDFLTRENLYKPTKYVVIAFRAVIIIGFLIWLLNVLKIFLVPQFPMNISFLINVFIYFFLETLYRFREKYMKPWMKYLVMTCVLVTIALLYMLLYFHTYLLVFLPILLAIPYHDKNLSVFTLIGMLIIAFFIPALSCFLGLWDTNFLIYLMRIAGKLIESTTTINGSTYLWQTFLYIGLPNALMILGISPFIYFVTKQGSDNVDYQIKIMELSELDEMTRVWNRNKFEFDIIKYTESSIQYLSCIYIDINDLHSINNQYGHGAGDLLIKTCAKALIDTFGSSNIYRIGGDEFVIFLKDASIERIAIDIENVKAILKQEDYSISAGIADYTESSSIQNLVKKAEDKMFEDKTNFYQNTYHLQNLILVDFLNMFFDHLKI